jgi:hypothetical protein
MAVVVDAAKYYRYDHSGVINLVQSCSSPLLALSDNKEIHELTGEAGTV